MSMHHLQWGAFNTSILPILRPQNSLLVVSKHDHICKSAIVQRNLIFSIDVLGSYADGFPMNE
jgi:hypothetical protein